MSKKLDTLLRLGLCGLLIYLAHYHVSVVWDSPTAICLAFAAGIVFPYLR